MDKDEIHVHEVQGLTVPGNNIAKYNEGYVVFIKSNPGKAFMTWFFEIIVRGFMSKMKHALRLEENTPGAVFFDGEYCQVEPWVNEESELVELFKQDNIAVAKLSAGTTGITQPFDAYKIFSAVHQLVNGQYLNGPHMANNKSMCEDLAKVLDAHSHGQRAPLTRRKNEFYCLALLASGQQSVNIGKSIWE